jgi:transposase
VKNMEVKLALALPDGLAMTRIEVSDKVLTITAISTQLSPCCPLCGTPASRVHSRYTRQIADLPCGGQRVRLRVQVRKYFCDVTTCARKIFAERLTPFVEPWARVTRRLYQIVQIIGLATGGRLGVRVTDRLGIQTSRRTILRRIMALPSRAVERVSQLGIDDFSFRRGRKFGTILVDLQTHQVIDLLPDRTVETGASWMQAHPELEIVSRDRGGNYAAAARQGAPQATQIADRFHLFVRRIGACLDSFQRKEGLRAKTPKTVAYLAGKPKEDSSMRQRQACPKAFTARSACLARHGEARLPNLVYQRR